MPLIIRPVRAEDKAQWLPLWQAYLVFYEHSLSNELTDLTFGRFLDPVEGLNMLVAEDDGGLVGFAAWLSHRSTWARTGYVYLEDLYVDPAVRGRGVGRALVETLKSQSQAAGFNRVYWTTQSDNATARRLYDQLADCPGAVLYTADLT